MRQRGRDDDNRGGKGDDGTGARLHVDRGDGEGREGTAQAQLDAQHDLLRHVLDPKGVPLPPRPPESLLFEEGERGTENYKAEGKSLGFCWCLAALGIDHADTRFWRGQYLDYMRGEHHEFMGAEQCAPDIHFQMYAAAHGMAHYLAAKYGIPELLAETTWWWSSLFGIADRCSVGGQVIVPCCNSRGDVPKQESWSTIWRARKGVGQKFSADKLSRDRTLVGYWAMTQPESRLAQIPIAKEIPRMRCPMSVTPTPGGYIATIGQPTQGDVDRRWVCSRVEVRDGAVVSVEKNWTPTP